jgi:ABC-type branched-subunit amino acid transport system substrate-binding protein
LAAARDSGLPRDAWILGTSEWKAGNMPEGAFVAAIDQSGLKHIADAFRRIYGRALSTEAAFAYDAVAVAAGIVRSKGIGGLSASDLQANAGFVGATGPFRFLGDGNIERRLAIYRVTTGTLKEHEPAQRQF